MARQWATTPALNEHGQPEQHVFQLGAGPVAQPPKAGPASEFEVSAAELADVVAPPPRGAAAQQAQVAKAPAEPKPLSTADVLRQLKARLRVVEREIKTRKTLEAERDQIQRLITAAKNERSNLRAIRATG